MTAPTSRAHFRAAVERRFPPDGVGFPAILIGMDLDFDTCYAALSRRDRDYDGRFFTGVTSTGIFCRPVCPAVRPKRRNCQFFPSAAAAMRAGFRPCLRCRPETAPHSPAWNGVATTVARALRLIEQGALAQHSIGELAARLGIGERYLRDLFARHVGASPKEVEIARRVLLAKRLITDSARPMADIAHATGFGSIRQFNDTFRRHFRQSPSALRQSHRTRRAGVDARRRRPASARRSSATAQQSPTTERRA
ncbi:MAG: bifunctional transcriptional activator/DNA repair enzyme AdaA [bacterium]